MLASPARRRQLPPRLAREAARFLGRAARCVSEGAGAGAADAEASSSSEEVSREITSAISVRAALGDPVACAACVAG